MDALDLLALLEDVPVPLSDAQVTRDVTKVQESPSKKRQRTGGSHSVASHEVPTSDEKKVAAGEVLTSTTWAQRLRCVMKEHLAQRGGQKRPLRLESSSSGMSTQSMALKDSVLRIFT